MRVSPGQSVTSNPLLTKASVINSTLEATEAYHLRKRLGEGTGGKATGRNPCIVKVKNDSGGNLAAGSVLEFTDFALDDDQVEQDALWFTGDTPDLTHVGYGILKRAVPSGEFGEAYVAGACRALVDVGDAGHKYARLKSGDTVLESAHSGPHRILYAPGTGTDKECAVHLHSGEGGARAGSLDAQLDQGTSITVNEIAWNGTDWEYTGETFTCYDFFENLGGSVAADTKVLCFPVGGIYIPVPFCEASDTLPGA